MNTTQRFTISHLLDALRKAKLPASKPTVLGYERAGIISKPNMYTNYKNRKVREYTNEDIAKRVNEVRVHMKKKQAKKAKASV